MIRISNILILLGGLGIALSATGLVLDRFYPSQIDFAIVPPEARLTGRSVPQRIIIPEMAIDLPVDPGVITDNRWSVTSSSANYLTTSARPGDAGNIIMYGHDSRPVFAKLKRAQEGQLIYIETKDGNSRTYRVDQVYATTPDDGSVIAATHEEVLTVYTCAGLFNEQRLVVRAKPVTAG